MSTFLSIMIIVLTLGSLVGCFWLIRWTSKPIVKEGPEAEGDTTGHRWDGLEELNNPLPRWWLWMFYITLVFAVIYFALYPGLGNFKGYLNWTQASNYEQEIEAAKKQYDPLFAAFAAKDIPTLAQDPKALKAGQRLFINYCSQCHGSDAGGAPGFPSLTDKSWLYGSQPEQIKTSILKGRTGVMPPFGAALGDDGVEEVAAYVRSLSGREADPTRVAAGQARFAACAACHGANGKGNQAIGAPDLTDGNWLYGGSPGVIRKTIAEGRTGRMPPHKDFLGEDKVHLLAAYVYSLSLD